MNYHTLAIDVISDDTSEWKKIVIEMAKTNPKALVAAADKVRGGWKVRSLELMNAGEKVAAVKHCRSATGMGLKEAKAAVEAL